MISSVAAPRPNQAAGSFHNARRGHHQQHRPQQNRGEFAKMRRDDGQTDHRPSPERGMPTISPPKPARGQHGGRGPAVRGDQASMGEDAGVETIHRARRHPAGRPVKLACPAIDYPAGETRNRNHSQAGQEQQEFKSGKIRGKKVVGIQPVPLDDEPLTFTIGGRSLCFGE